jgi:hypothetical protein
MNNLAGGGFELQSFTSVPLNFLRIQVGDTGSGILLLMLLQAGSAPHYFFFVILGFEIISVIYFMYIRIME